MPPPSAPLKESSNDVFAARSGSSPLRVKSLPFRVIDSGANDSDGTLTFGAVTVGAVSVTDASTLGIVTSTSASLSLMP